MAIIKFESTKYLFMFFLLTTVLSGCVSIPKPIAFTSNIPENQKIGILIGKPVAARVNFTGSIGLLELPVILAVNSSLTTHLTTLTFDSEFSRLPKRIRSILEKNKSVEIEYIPVDTLAFLAHKEGISQNDYSIYKDKYNLNYLLVLQAAWIGITRPYYSIMPTAPPTANASIRGELVDLSNKKVLWYREVATNQAIPEPWDEKETRYANLTDSIYLAFNQAMDKIAIDFQYPKEAVNRE